MPRRIAFSEADLHRMKSLYLQGESMEAIAPIFGCSRDTVRVNLEQMGISRRNRFGRTTDTSRVPQTTWAYVAGLFDGEGSICIALSRRHGKPGYHWLQVGITNTNQSLIEWLATTFGGHVSDSSHVRVKRNQRPCQTWRVCNNAAQDFLEKVRPYLRAKKEQADVAIEFQRAVVAHTRGPVSTDVLDQRERFRSRLKDLRKAA